MERPPRALQTGRSLTRRRGVVYGVFIVIFICVSVVLLKSKILNIPPLIAASPTPQTKHLIPSVINNEIITSTESSADLILSDAVTNPDFYPEDDLSDIKLPNTKREAHVRDEFSQWQIPKMTQKGLYKAFLNSPINPKTGRHCIMYSLLNEGMINFATNMYCSMLLVGIQSNQHVMVALDAPSYQAMKSIGAQVVYLESNFSRKAVNTHWLVDYCSLLKMKPTIVHQFILWDAEVITVDVDIVFMENPLSLFNDEADFEVQSDSDIYPRIPTDIQPPIWKVNLGFFKVRPSPVNKEVFPLWLEKLYTVSKIATQSGLRKLLRPLPLSWLNNDTLIVSTVPLLRRRQQKYSNMTFRYLDPMYICNSGAIYFKGKDEFRAEAVRRNITRPWIIHYFHIGKNKRKNKIMVNKGTWLITDDRKCVKEQTEQMRVWKIWKKKT